MLSLIKSLFTMNFLLTVIRLSTPIFFASIASFIAGITGIGNIAIESIMTFGALAGILGSYVTSNAWLGLLVGLCIGILTALLIAFFSMKLGASSIFVGIALNTFADSLAIFFLYQIAGEKGTSASLLTPTLSTVNLPGLSSIPVLGDLLSGQYVLTYLCWILLVFLYVLVYKTPLGMRMRACGLNPDAAKTAGVNVERLQVLSLVMSGIFAALGGMYLSLNYLRIFSKGMVAGQGWMGIAANGIANGSYGVLLLSSLIFAAFRAVSIVFNTSAILPTDLVSTVPYLAVFIFVTGASIINYYRVKHGKVEEQ